jgi:hypothetical protein
MPGSREDAENWASKLDSENRKDLRQQAWKSDVGDMVADREFIGYKPHDKMDLSDLMLATKTGPGGCNCPEGECTCGRPTLAG